MCIDRFGRSRGSSWSTGPGSRQLCAFDDVSGRSVRDEIEGEMCESFRTDLPDLGVAMVEELD